MRKKLSGTQERPRLCVFKSAKHIYAQIIDDTKGHTLVAASSTEKSVTGQSDAKKKISIANLVGKTIGIRAVEKGYKKVVFDRSGFLYHGRIKAVSEGAREAGLDF
uniref:Large ribosomal subunit protein uL18 n=1 Tax=uncultured Desulfobacterium sp. TaxID=201089 RepID=E1YG73_9BACT|nr:50S ribosomal protein L18 [uncultured Desulfobacterium sp.]